MPKGPPAIASRTGNVLSRRLQVVGLGAVLILALAHAAVDLAAPPPSPGDWTWRKRVLWYCSSRQWCADVRTLAAVVEYLAETEEVSPLPSPERMGNPILGCGVGSAKEPATEG
jgi:hypothetical protein